MGGPTRIHGNCEIFPDRDYLSIYWLCLKKLRVSAWLSYKIMPLCVVERDLNCL